MGDAAVWRVPSAARLPLYCSFYVVPYIVLRIYSPPPMACSTTPALSAHAPPDPERSLNPKHHKFEYCNRYALLLHDQLQQYDKAENYYKKILSSSPSSDTKARVLCSYARLLQHVREDHDAAEMLYRQVVFGAVFVGFGA